MPGTRGRSRTEGPGKKTFDARPRRPKPTPVMRPPHPFLTCLFALLAVVRFADAAASRPERPPNIVLFITDDLGWGDVGCYGGTGVDTPHIDRLAARGTRFVNAYAPSATCTPSRYSLLSGQYAWRRPPQRTGILTGDAPLAFDPALPTVATFLREQGYATGLIGKWHLGLGDGSAPIDFNGVIAPGPLQIGFDTAFFIPATVDRVPTVYIEGDRVFNLDPADPIRVSYDAPIGDEPTGVSHPHLRKVQADRQHSDTITNGISRIGYMSGGRAARWVDEDLADVITERGVRFIEANRDRPFFLHFGTHDPHVPRTPHPRFVGRSRTGVRGDTIAQIDWCLGEIMAALERHGLAERTLVLFTSDNGPVLFDGYYDDSAEDNGDHRPAGGLRGWKYLRYEGGTRVPLIAHWPGVTPAGATNEALVSLVDLFASTAGLLGRPMPAGAGRDGMDLSALWRGRTPETPRTNVVQHGIGNVLSIRSGDWKFIPKNADTTTGTGGASRTDTRFDEAAVLTDELYDLADDPGERRNLAAAHPEKLEELRALLESITAGPPA